MTGYRKLIMVGAAVVVLLLLEIFGAQVSTETQETIRWLVGAFAAGNSLEWVAQGLLNKAQGGELPKGGGS